MVFIIGCEQPSAVDTLKGKEKIKKKFPESSQKSLLFFSNVIVKKDR
jgi:hypothetical protein